MSWVTNSAVLRSRRQIACNSSCSSSRVCESSAPNGSSISRTAGSSANSRASATRCFMPPLKLRRIEIGVARQMHQIEILARLGEALRLGDAFHLQRPARRSRCAVSQGNSERSWNIMPRSGPGRPIGRPSSGIAPPLAGSKPPTMCRNVLLPQPDGPTIETNSCCVDRERELVDRGDRLVAGR